jgi:photosystem II stability/assembly factor-like uncharacterized protein
MTMFTRIGALAVAASLIGGSAAWPGSPASAASAPPAYPTRLFSGLSYRMVGPSRGGRVTAVAGHRAQPSVFYMGSAGGGVWKTTDYGVIWTNVSDGYLATGSIGAIRVAESDPNVVYVGTGSDGLRSNVVIGKGVYRSRDAGQTWSHLALEKIGNVGALLIHPRDPDLVYVAAIGNPFAPNPERGVFRTRDGGQSWEKVLFVSEKTGAVDLEFAPDDPAEIYATLWRAERKPWTIISGGHEGGVYKSNDGGDTWRPVMRGLPGGLRGKADLAVSAGDPDRVYVLIEAPGTEGGVYRSDDRGESWFQVTDFDKIRTRPFYYTNLEAHPRDPDVLWGMTEGFWRSDDAGKTWTRQPVPHGDNHDMWINPDNPDVFIQSNDGGANVTTNGGASWSTQHNQPTAELYQVDLDDQFPYRLYAGQQDNTTISVPSRPPRYFPGGHTALWEAHGGCETGPAVPRPGDPAIVYANCKGRFGLYNRRTGREQQYYVGFSNIYGHNPKDLAFRFQRVAPIHVSPHNPDRVYHASQFVHVTEDGGRSWRTISPDLTAFDPETQVVSGTPITIDVTGEEHFSALYDVQESPHEAGVIWVGANDGPIHLTRDGGATWINVTPEGIGPHGRVQNIEVSPHRPAKAYAAILRYQLGDFEPHAYRTEDYGATWTRITTGANGIPVDYPVRVVREDPDREGLLYAGTEFGMFVSFDDGGHWQRLQLDLPVTPVTDIKVAHQDLVLSTMGRGFWILDDVTPLLEVSRQVATSEVHLYAVRDSYRLYEPPRTRHRPRPEAPQYPPVGANVDYYLADEPAGEIRLEILDGGGEVIRAYSSEAPTADGCEPSEESADAVMQGDDARAPASVLPKGPGIHRFVWDLRYDGPAPGGARGAERRGPLVPPGRYQARLVVDDWSATRLCEVRMDPRSLKEGITEADVAAQIELALQVRDTLSAARRTADRIEAGSGQISPEARKTLAEIRARLVSAAVRYSQPMLLDQLAYLYGNLVRADQRPGRDAYERFAELDEAVRDLAQGVDQILGPERPPRDRGESPAP